MSKRLFFNGGVCAVLASVFVLVSLGGCGGGRDSPPGNPTLRGTFVDSPVSGLAYSTPAFEGTTDSSGAFAYEEGETVTFSLGGISFGSAPASAVVTPIQLVSGGSISHQAVINRCVLLQTLDEDGDLNNGITINSATRSVVAAADLAGFNFDQTPAAFAADPVVNALLAALNLNNAAGFTSGEPEGRKLRSATEAQGHLRACLSARKIAATTFGQVKGYASDNLWIWKGIPFAAPPVGGLRWKAPVDPPAWSGVREATAFCSACTQEETDTFWRPTGRYVGSENCLYLNVYRPQTEETGLPVYVWMHGGANVMGSAKLYGTELAKRGNIVVVVVQYRLSFIGWMSHPALRTGSAQDQSGNYGTLDHIQALDWVYDNIAAFGGDPARVTIGGQSAGGHNALNLMMSPQPGVNFHRVFAQSPALSEVMGLKTPATGESEANLIIEWLLAHDPAQAGAVRTEMTHDEIAAYLRSKPAGLILVAAGDAGLGGMSAGYMDGTVLPAQSWLESIEAGKYKKIPLLIGSTQYEFKDLLPLYSAALKPYGIPSGSFAWNDLYRVLDGTLTLNQVLPTATDRYVYEQLGLLKSRRWQMECNDIAQAVKTQDSSNPVYAYHFTWAGGGDPDLADFRFIFGGSHAQDVPFFFGEDRDLFGYSFTAANQGGRLALQGAMMDYLLSFIKTGDPNAAGSDLPNWTQWSNAADADKYIVFDADLNRYAIDMASAQATHTVVGEEITAFRTATGGSMDFALYEFGILPMP